MMPKQKLCFLDVETSGKNPKQSGILKLAGKVVCNDEEICRFNYRMRPIKSDVIEAEAMSVNKIDRQEMLSWPDPQDVLRDFIFNLETARAGDSWLENLLIPVGFNVGFDMGFLREWFYRCGSHAFPKIFSFVQYDVYHLVHLLGHFKVLPQFPQYKLTAVCASLNIPLKDAHDAMADVEATEKVFNLCKQNLRWETPVPEEHFV